MEIKDKLLLRRIANTIISFLPETKGIGLFEGNTGICLFLYMYSKLSGEKEYSNISDLLLSEITDGIVKEKHDYSAYSISSFGIGVLYLLSHGMIDNDSSSLLSRIDNMVLGKATEGFIGKESNPYSHICLKGVYLLFRLKWIDEKTNGRLMNRFLSEIDSFYKKIPEKGTANLLLSQSISLLYVMLSLQKVFNYQNKKIASIIDKIAVIIKNNDCEPSSSNIHYALCCCLDLLNPQDDLYALLKEKRDLNFPQRDIEAWYENAWMDFLYQRRHMSSFDKKDLIDYINKRIENSYYTKYSVSFGLASVGVGYMFNYYNDLL